MIELTIIQLRLFCFSLFGFDIIELQSSLNLFSDNEQTFARGIKQLKVKDEKLRYERFGDIFLPFLENRRQHVLH